MRWLTVATGREFADYSELWSWSVADPAGFWESIWRYFDVRSKRHYNEVLSKRTMPGARWFVGAELNYAEHALRFGGGGGERPALIQVGEDGSSEELSWSELGRAVGSVGQALRERGIGKGDVVAAYLPNCIEAAVAYLACASVGATWASCAPDLAPAAALDRFAQLRPAVLLATDGHHFGGRWHDRGPAIVQLAEGLGDLQFAVSIRHLVDHWASVSVRVEPWEALVASPCEPDFEAVPFDHPLCVLFSSGTTGPPKGIVHGHGGLLLDHFRHHALHLDLGAEDRFFFFTTTGWMIWNWLVAGLLVGSTIVLYDGSPRYPDLDAQFALVDSQDVTVFGTSAAYLTACARAGLTPGHEYGLTRLRAILSTASPLPADVFHWISEAVAERVWPVSTSGGTDICSAFVSGCPLLPVRAGEIQSRCLGAAVDVFDEYGQSLRGTVGELVITEPLPSMPVRFWDDPDGERYRAAYFEDFPGIWRHGDWAAISEEGSVVILGRSDSTLNRHGIRIGTAEIYSAVEALPEIADSLVVGVEDPAGGYWMPLFVALVGDHRLTVELEHRIAQAIRSAASPRHLPDEVREVPAIPRTLTGKKLEVPVKRMLMGLDPMSALSQHSVANPEALDYFAALSRERRAASVKA